VPHSLTHGHDYALASVGGQSSLHQLAAEFITAAAPAGKCSALPYVPRKQALACTVAGQYEYRSGQCGAHWSTLTATYAGTVVVYMCLMGPAAVACCICRAEATITARLCLPHSVRARTAAAVVPVPMALATPALMLMAAE
jgi:hypothetical protein